MKITNSEVIKSGEQELIDGITAELDWAAIEEVFRNEHKLGIEEDVEYKRGDIVVHNNQIAYKLEFEVRVPLSVLLDREGNYLSLTVPEVGGERDLENGVMQEDGATEPQDGYKEVLEELDSDNKHDIQRTNSSISERDESQENISQLASQAGEIVRNIADDA